MTAALTSVGVQYGSVTIASGATTGTATVTAVGAGGFLLYQGQNTAVNTASPSTGLARLSISGTTVTATRNASTTASVTIYFALVDGNTTNLIKSVQYGTINFGTATTGTAAISAVTTANTAVHCLGFTSTATTTSPITLWPALSLTSTTQVTATVGSAPGTNAITVGFVVIEFQGAALNSSVQAIADVASPAATTRTKTITSVTLNNSFIIWAGQLTTGGASYAQGDQYGQLTAATTLTIGTNSAGSLSIQYNCYVVELVSALVETATQRGNISIAAGTSGTAALSPTYTLADAVMTYGGNQTNGTTFDTRNSALSGLTSSQVTASTNTSATTKTGWEVIALNPVVGISFDAATNSTYQAASSSYSWSHTCTGSNRFLAVDIAMLSLAQTVSDITYAGISLEQIGIRASVTGACRIECWGMPEPATGSNTIAVTLSGSIASAGTAVSYTGVNQNTPYEAFNSAQATNVGAADATVTITTVADNDWVHAAVATDDTSITSNNTSRNNVTGAGGSGADSDTNAVVHPAGTQAMSWTGIAALATWAIGGYGIRPTAASNLGALAPFPWSQITGGMQDMTGGMRN